jgi:tRNA(Ile)-lysidine synthetase-like protein
MGDYTTIQSKGNKLAESCGLWYNKQDVSEEMGAKHLDILKVVRKEVEQGKLLRPGATIVVGVSGGSDSLCLLHVLERLRRRYDWSLHIAHLNHCLRGAEGDGDMLFVAQWAIDLAVPCTIEAIDVAAAAQERRLSLEEAARQVRYGFLADVSSEIDADAVAVGHQADDQTETVLMRILRGTGLAGLGGMRPSTDLCRLTMLQNDGKSANSGTNVRLVRPLLSVPRVEIERYCQENDLGPRFDRSNLDLSHFRNRLRHELLPLLETYNPNIKTILRRNAAVVAADYEILTTALQDVWAQVVTEEETDCISFDLKGWRSLPLALQRAVVRHAAYQLRPDLRDMGFVHVEQAVEIVHSGRTGAQATLPQGLCVAVGYETLRISDKDRSYPAPDWPLLWSDEPVPVAAPGETSLPQRPPSCQASAKHAGVVGEERSRDWSLEVSLWDGERSEVFTNPDRWTAYLNAERLGPNLNLRKRRPGDRFQPLGMAEHEVELADFMINAKIPRHWRGNIPLLVSGSSKKSAVDGIVWVVGWRIDERAKVTAGTRSVARLRWRRSANSEAKHA